jgi:DNA-binding transcriptional ArsR family regulator
LERLHQGDASVNELAADVRTPRQNVSEHLDKLDQLRIIERRKEGNQVVYHLADQTALELIEVATSGLSRQLGELAALAPKARRQATRPTPEASADGTGGAGR